MSAGQKLAVAGIVGIALCLTCGVNHAAEVAPPMIFVEDFESGAMDLESQFIQSGNSPTISQEQVRSGQYAMKSYLNRNTSTTKFRTEVVPRMPDTRVGDEVWYGFSIFLPSSYSTSQTWEVVAQWHDTPNDWDNLARQNPPLQMGITRNTGIWKITDLWDADVVQPGNVFDIDGVKAWELGPYDKNRWTDWVFHIKWSFRADGILQVWKNGVLVVDYQGPNTYNDIVGPYFKMGLYKGWKDDAVDNVSERTLYHDELRIAGADGTYADVAPEGVHNPAWTLIAE